MGSNAIPALKAQLHSELGGTPEEDRAVLEEWAERYRGKAEFELLLKEIGRLLFEINAEPNSLLAQRVLSGALAAAEQAFSAAEELIRQGQYDAAAQKLAPVTDNIIEFSPAGDCIWMDFHSMLDGLLYQDYFSEEISGREIKRHPMRPGKYLYTYGSLLIEAGRAGEAAEPLERLVSLDPVCPQYLFELGEAYKRTGRLQEAFDASAWALSCASNGAELARCCRNMAFCLSETAQYEEAALLCQLSLRFQPSPSAEAELAWIAQKTGTPPQIYTDRELAAQCEQRGYPMGLSETVMKNQKLLDGVFGQKGEL